MKPLWLLLGLCLWAAPLGATPFLDNGDSTVTDQASGLMWDQRESTAMTWDTALTTCEGSVHAGYTDWRLPNRNELESLVDDTKTTAPALDIIAFPSGLSNPYWASTTNPAATGFAWFVNFSSGLLGSADKALSSYYVRCVR